MTTSTKADCLLLLVTVFWGLTFPLMQIIVHAIDPSVFVFYRFLMATLVLLPFVLSLLGNTNRTVLVAGIFLGLLNAGIYFCQTMGLETIDAPRAAFITGSAVVIVPFLLPLLRLGLPTIPDVIFAFICLIGLYILTGASIHTLHSGDFWELVGACLSATAIVYIQWITPRCRHYLLLAFYQIIFTVPVAGLLPELETFKAITIPAVFGVALFCGIFATAIALFIQTKYQQFTSAPKAALIYALEPVFAVIFAWWISGTPLSKHMMIGGAIMLGSIVLTDSLKLYRAHRQWLK